MQIKKRRKTRGGGLSALERAGRLVEGYEKAPPGLVPPIGFTNVVGFANSGFAGGRLFGSRTVAPGPDCVRTGWLVVGFAGSASGFFGDSGMGQYSRVWFRRNYSIRLL